MAAHTSRSPTQQCIADAKAMLLLLLLPTCAGAVPCAAAAPVPCYILPPKRHLVMQGNAAAGHADWLQAQLQDHTYPLTLMLA
jgi:hypothetical protein